MLLRILYPNQIGFRFFDLFFFPLASFKNETVTTAMLEFFASLKEKITYPKFPKSYLIRVYQENLGVLNGRVLRVSNKYGYFDSLYSEQFAIRISP